MGRSSSGVVVIGVLTVALAFGAPLQASIAVAQNAAVGVADPADAPEPAVPDEPATCTIGPAAECAGADLSGRDLKGVDLSGANLTSASLDHADASGANLSRADLLGASLHQVTLDEANLASADLTNGHLTQASVRRASGQGMNASWASLVKSDFTGSDFTGGSFRSAMGTQVDFSDARLVDADLTGADLFGANLARADLTGALLRNASLLQAKVDASTTLTGADLSGATWVDGRECAEGSIGSCAFTSEIDPDVVTAELPGNPLAVMAVINFALNMGKLASDCSKNVPKTGSCWDAGGPDLSAITKGIEALRKQMEANQQALLEAMNTIFEEQKYQAMLNQYRSVSKELDLASIAMLKQQEFINCLAQFNDPTQARGTPRTCTITDLNGDNPRPYEMKTIDDLYDGSDGPLTDQMSRSGPLARLYFATLYQFGGKGAYELSNLNTAATSLQGNIAGRQAMRLKDGLLEATVDWVNAGLISQQNGTTGRKPTFIPATYLIEMNNWSGYYVNGQASLLSSIIAALTIRANRPGQSKADRDGQLDMANTLTSLAREGTPQQRHWSLTKQLDAYTTSLPFYGVDATVPKPASSAVGSPPSRVGLVIGSDGKIYRIEHMAGATQEPTGNPQFVFPTFNTVALLRSSIDLSGAKWASIRRAYPLTIPSAEGSAWWADFGSRYRKVELVSEPRLLMYQVSDQSPGSGVFGQNVTYLTYNEPCRIPVRMPDTPLTMSESRKADAPGGTGGDPDFAQQVFPAREQFAKKPRIFNVTVDGRYAYTTIVRTAATPAFAQLPSGAPGKGSWTVGTGVLWECNGDIRGYNTRPTPANWVSIKSYEPAGLLTKLSSGPVRFESCTELRAADWRGIGLPTARDQDRPDDPELANLRLNGHRWDADWYDVNKHLDVDRDGIACEVGQ